MRSKKVNRYWCDHCNKSGLQAHAMARHEAHCTLNPARNCRVCTLVNGGYKVGAERMAELVAILPDADTFIHAPVKPCSCINCAEPWESPVIGPCKSGETERDAEMAEAMKRLREETDNCPACILAALRQRKIPVPMVESFNFTAEMKEVFKSARDNEWPF